MKCPCGSNLELNNCCEPFLNGTTKPDTAEKLMRSRYTAFTRGDVEYLKNTLAPESRHDFDINATKKWAQEAKWKGLKILECKQGGPDDKKGSVEFIATYEVDGEGLDHHEVSQFRRADGQWYFVEGDSHTHPEGQGHQHHHKVETVVRESPKIGRNDPCICGSGKKYKKCCGADAVA